MKNARASGQTRLSLGAPHMQFASPENDIVPAQGDKLAGAQPVADTEAFRNDAHTWSPRNRPGPS